MFFEDLNGGERGEEIGGPNVGQNLITLSVID